MTEEKLLEPLNATRQLVMRHLAKYVISHKCDKILDLIEAIKILISDPNIGLHPLQKHYKEKTPLILQTLNKIQASHLHVKTYYEGLDAKTILKNDINDPKFKEFQKHTGHTHLIDQKIYEIFYTLFKQTTIKDMSIPAEAFAQEYRTYKSFELEEEEQKMKKEKAEEDIIDEE